MLLTYPFQPCPTHPTVKHVGGKVVVGLQQCRLAINSLWTKAAGNFINRDTTGPSSLGSLRNRNVNSTLSADGFQKKRRR
jgi:hypothetical protein